MCHGTLSYGHLSRKLVPKDEDEEEWYSVDVRTKSWFYITCDPGVYLLVYISRSLIRIY